MHRTWQELVERLPDLLTSPRDAGALVAIVARPAEDERRTPGSARLTPEGGLEGDRWSSLPGIRLPDGTLDTRGQVSLMNARVLRLLAGDDERLALAGDNLVVDLDLGEENLPPGQRLRAGGALLEMTAHPHTGCTKFAARFGADARRFVNAPEYHAHHLRGRYARVIEAGVVRRGDLVVRE